MEHKLPLCDKWHSWDDLPDILPWRRKAFRAALLALMGLSGCVNGVSPTPEQSWDQANLKRFDSGCPTAIYVSPNGVLELCPPE